ncbi:hypothetical protein GUY60_14065 [Streptomyces sp. YC537]|uniref:Uncharacterized protein n=1 Tax=Streptomyces boluensis TaxID=1775135 RepID=A0A964UQA5_9ACTN|nr:hypothetical protein [Streptomyces boluensis]NBE52531.1 hypothetical protein [Streptomyces boluensis]
MVTPAIDAAISGLLSPDRTSVSACPVAANSLAIPAIAAAALARIGSETRFTPAMSTTLCIIVRSAEPTYGDTSPAAIEDTINFGMPSGSSRIARLAIDVPPLPPTARTPCTRPSACSRTTTSAAPRAIAVTATPRSPVARSRSRSSPAARATSARGMSAGISGSPATPVSTTTTRTAYRRSRSRSQRYSSPLVSSVPSSTTLAMAVLSGETPTQGKGAQGWHDDRRPDGEGDTVTHRPRSTRSAPATPRTPAQLLVFGALLAGALVCAGPVVGAVAAGHKAKECVDMRLHPGGQAASVTERGCEIVTASGATVLVPISGPPFEAGVAGAAGFVVLGGATVTVWVRRGR